MDLKGRKWRETGEDYISGDSANVIRVIKSGELEWRRVCRTCGRNKNALKILVGKPEGT
jgi:hypothetical protein